MMEMVSEIQCGIRVFNGKVDTSTPMGRAMLNICIVFAQLERETIQKRVSDAIYSRSQRGFRMGGKPPYGYRLEPVVIQGIHTKKLVACEAESQHIRQMFEMYAQPPYLIWRYYPVFYGNGNYFLWKRTDPADFGANAAKSCICTG